jgi:alpha-mannosidase
MQMKSVLSLCALLLTGLIQALAGPPGSSEGSPSRLKEVIVVYKTHFDIGFTDLAKNVVDNYRTSMIDKALAVADQSRELPPDQRFIWTIPGWPMTQILWSGQDPRRRERVLAAYRSGQFVTHALPFTTHTESLDLEDLVRGLGFSSRLARSSGLALPRDAKMTDVPSHSWIIPTVLRHAGVDFLHIGSNQSVWNPEVPPLFWWEGADGSRLLTMYATEYGTKLEPPAGWPHSTWLALVHSGDNHGPPTSESVRNLLDMAKAKMPGVRIRMGRLSDFYDAIVKERPELPVVRADMPDTWIHGVMSMPEATRQARNVRPQIAALELLNTLLSSWHAGELKPGIVSSAYEQSLLYGEHTWGMTWGQFGKFLYGKEWEKARASGSYKKLEDSWAEHADYSATAGSLIAGGMKSSLQALALSVDAQGRRVVAFNPLPWRRDGLVEVDVKGAAPAALRDAQSGAVLPVDGIDGKIRFVARDVPAAGYRTYAAVESNPLPPADLAADTVAGTIENRRLRVTLDPRRGGVASILDKRTGQELVDRKSEYPFAQYVRERFDRDQVDRYVDAYVKVRFSWALVALGKTGLPPASESRYAAVAAHPMTMQIRKDAASVSAVMKAEPTSSLPHRVALTVTLHANQEFVEITLSIDGKEATPWPEAGWLALPMNVSSPAFKLGRLGAIVDPAKDVVRGASHDFYHLTTGMAVVEPGGRGVGMCPLDSPVVSLDRPGMWMYSKDFQPKRPMVWVNLYNNQWSTNFARWISGSWSSRIRVWPIDRYDGWESIVMPAYEARSPVLGAMAEGAGGVLPRMETGLELSRKGVVVTAFGKNPDGKGLLLRLWEQAGKDGLCTVTAPRRLKAVSVQLCDLRGRPVGGAIKVERDQFAVPVHRFAPTSVLIQAAGID